MLAGQHRKKIASFLLSTAKARESRVKLEKVSQKEYNTSNL